MPRSDPRPDAADPAAAPRSADGLLRQDPRVVELHRTIGWILSGSIAAVQLAVVATTALLGNLRGGWLVAAGLGWALVSGLLAWHLHRWPAVRFRHVAYRLDGLGIEIRRGAVWRRVLTVPRSRIQHTDVSQGPLERDRGLATLVVYTAGTDYERIELDGLAYTDALELRDRLLAPLADDER